MTTSADIRSLSGIQLGMVMCIEGYPYLIHTGGSLDNGPVIAAWSATPWSRALPGLRLGGSFEQEYKPFSNDLTVSHITAFVEPEETDQFGQDVFKSSPSYNGALTVTYDPNDTTLNVKNTTGLASSGTVYVGTKAYSYTGKTATTLTGVASLYGVFSRDTGTANQFPGKHDVATHDSVHNPAKVAPPKVKDVPDWIGRKVGIWVHRIAGGVWDLKADARLEFTGTIINIGEGNNGETVLELEDMRSQIADTVILEDQWSARPQEGIRLVAGQWFNVWFNRSNTVFIKGGRLTVVSSGASGTDEINAGEYTADEIITAIADFVENDTTLDDANSVTWDVGLRSSDSGQRMVIRANRTASVYASLFFVASNADLLAFLGFEAKKFQTTDGWYAQGNSYYSDTWEVVGDAPPLRQQPIAIGTTSFGFASAYRESLGIEGSSGTFHDLTDDLPPEAKESIDAGETWSYFHAVDRGFFLAKKTSDTLLEEIITDTPILKALNHGATSIDISSNKDGEPVAIRQVCILADSLTNILTKLLASVDGTGKNHATYDAFPFGAQIPWDLLGSNWLNSCADVEEMADESALTVVVERPTKLWDLIKSDLVVRGASLIWKDEGYQLATLPLPNASNADHTITTADIAGTAGSDLRPETEIRSLSWLTNNVKLMYDRDPQSDKYGGEMVIRNSESIQRHGLSKPLTIKARNVYGRDSAEALGAAMTARLMPPFGRPLRTWSFPVGHQLFHAAPGDTASFAAMWVRDPTTGQRTISSARGATVLRMSHSFGFGSEYGGRMTLLYSEEDRTFPMAPVAEMDETYSTGLYTNGYDSTNFRIATKPHAYSEAADDVDVAGIAVNDEVALVEMDPVNPATASYITRTVTAVSTISPYYVGLDSSVSLTAGAVYRVVPVNYSSTVTSQRTRAFQADDADGRIEDLADPNTYGDDRIVSFTSADTTELTRVIANNLRGDGVPIHAGLYQDLARLKNNLINYRCAPQANWNHRRVEIVRSLSSGTWACIGTYPLYLGNGIMVGGRRRKLGVAVQMRSSSGATTGTVRVSSSENPPSGDGDWEDVVFSGSRRSVVFTVVNDATIWTTTAEQDLEIVASKDWPDITWITVETQDDTAFKEICFLGMKELE